MAEGEQMICDCGCRCQPDGVWHWDQERWCVCAELGCPCVTDQPVAP